MVVYFKCSYFAQLFGVQFWNCHFTMYSLYPESVRKVQMLLSEDVSKQTTEVLDDHPCSTVYDHIIKETVWVLTRDLSRVNSIIGPTDKGLTTNIEYL